MNKENNPAAPDALMLLSSHCAFCPGVLNSLAEMIKQGDIANLHVINLEKNPDAMQKYKVRSVPWVRIGNHELSGSQTLEALKQRAKWAQKDLEKENNTDADFDFLLSDGQVNKVIDAIKKAPEKIQSIISLLEDPGTVLSSRIGIGVVFEELANSELLKSLIPQLEKLTKHSDERIRADAYHYLGLTNDKSAIPILEAGKNSEEDEEVKDIIEDSLEELQSI